MPLSLSWLINGVRHNIRMKDRLRDPASRCLWPRGQVNTNYHWSFYGMSVCFFEIGLFFTHGIFGTWWRRPHLSDAPPSDDHSLLVPLLQDRLAHRPHVDPPEDDLEEVVLAKAPFSSRLRQKVRVECDGLRAPKISLLITYCLKCVHLHSTTVTLYPSS